MQIIYKKSLHFYSCNILLTLMLTATIDITHLIALLCSKLTAWVYFRP